LNNQTFVNGTRIDSINNLNYLKLIQSNLYIGFLNRANTSWGSCVLIGIDTATLVSDELLTYVNKDVSGEELYAKLFNENGTDDVAQTPNDDSHLWKILRINSKWMLIENLSTDVTVDFPDGVSYTDFSKNLIVSDDSYVVDIYKYDAGFTKINFDDPDDLILPIRYKNSDSHFYYANKTVHLSSSGTTNPVYGFENLTLLENSKDNTSIKIVDVPDSIFSQINQGSINIQNRRFDVVDSTSNAVLIRNITYDTVIDFNDVKMLKFYYSTQKGEKVLLATNNVYENVYEIYPDYVIDLLTEMVNDNSPPGIDYTYTVDNFMLDSLFIPTSAEDTFDYTNFHHWDFIESCKATVYFSSLANESNRTISGTNGMYIDDSVYTALAYGNGSTWGAIKENNLNKLLLNFNLFIPENEPLAPDEFDLWIDSGTLKMWNGTDAWITLTDTDIRQIGVFYINGSDRDLIYLTNINKIAPAGNMNIQIIL